MLSRPGALPDFNFLMAASSSSTVKSDDRLASAVAALERELSSRDVQRAKVSVCTWKCPLSVAELPSFPIFREISRFLIK